MIKSLFRYLKKAPVLIVVTSMGLLFTIIAAGGKENIYQDQRYEFRNMPVLALVFQGIHDDIYPWEIFADREPTEYAVTQVMSVETIADAGSDQNVVVTPVSTAAPEEWRAMPDKETEKEGATGENPDNLEENEIIQPFRSSTHEEYLNHISADIYGTIGVEQAGDCEFSLVEENYFDDALIIGDSRMVGLRDYTSLSQRADFICSTALTIYDIFEEKINNQTVEQLLRENEYKKLYLSVGINELGRGTTEEFIETYRDTVNRLIEMEPEAILFLQAIMKVSKTRNDRDTIFNNQNIEARNRAIATLADNQTIFYIDSNQVVCDEEGNLSDDYTYDEIHLFGIHNELIKQFLLEHGVTNT